MTITSISYIGKSGKPRTHYIAVEKSRNYYGMASGAFRWIAIEKLLKNIMRVDVS